MQALENEILSIPTTYDLYQSISAIALEAGGLLVFYGELSIDGLATAVAANIAGAASLGVDADAGRVKQAVRQGACDFMVTGLDEALRILKNEIRKKQPVAVGLVSDPQAVAAEMIERGVQPDLLSQKAPEAEVFLSRGARLLEVTANTPDSVPVKWSVERDAALWLPKVDALAMEMLGTHDVRARWLRLAPRYLRKSLQHERYVRLSAEEQAHFADILRARMQSGEIAVPVSVVA